MAETLAGKTVLVTGSLGMLAGDLLPRLLKEEARIVPTDIFEREQRGFSSMALDITNLKEVREVVRDLRPAWIVNCAAYTAVDAAETHQELAFVVNATGPANLARAAFESDAKLLHLSTDYVFGGDKQIKRTMPYSEDQPFAPCGVYGQSKRAGDEAVLSTIPGRHLIVRTSWLHGIYGPNFISTILKLSAERKEIPVVNDQIGSPTWSVWLADTMVRLMKLDQRGLFHVASRGNISWFDFAQEIVRLAKLQVEIKPQSTALLARPAPRPSYSTLDVSKLESTLGETAITWQAGLNAHLQALGVV